MDDDLVRTMLETRTSLFKLLTAQKSFLQFFTLKTCRRDQGERLEAHVKLIQFDKRLIKRKTLETLPHWLKQCSCLMEVASCWFSVAAFSWLTWFWTLFYSLGSCGQNGVQL